MPTIRNKVLRDGNISHKIQVKAKDELLGEVRRIRNEIKNNPDAKYDPGCKNQ